MKQVACWNDGKQEAQACACYSDFFGGVQFTTELLAIGTKEQRCGFLIDLLKFPAE